MKRFVMLTVITLLTTACQSDDYGITKLDNCVCYKTPEGQHIQLSQVASIDPDTLQENFSHCVCRALIDLKKVDDPGKFFVPGTEIKTQIK